MNSLDKAVEANKQYPSMLALMASLSNLFSESSTPFIHYRITENLFCKYIGAENLSRTDTAYDAKWNDIGVGIKTFILNNDSSTQKIAEFNALSSVLSRLNGLELAYKLADFRNDRMEVANGLYGIKQSLYHIIGRSEGILRVFNTPYELIDKEKISILKNNDKGIHFTDGKNHYSFQKSKSVLLKEFILPKKSLEIKVNIAKDPFTMLEQLLGDAYAFKIEKPQDSIILPLFSKRGENKYVPEKSGLNQWNAGGRVRDENEVYIPIPASVHRKYPNFFPGRDTIFTLHLPDGSSMNAKLCQQGCKALMSNPNKALGQWILRKVLHKKPDTIVTYADLEIAGFDSLIITKNDFQNYSVSVCRDNSFEY